MCAHNEKPNETEKVPKIIAIFVDGYFSPKYAGSLSAYRGLKRFEEKPAQKSTEPSDVHVEIRLDAANMEIVTRHYNNPGSSFESIEIKNDKRCKFINLKSMGTRVTLSDIVDLGLMHITSVTVHSDDRLIFKLLENGSNERTIEQITCNYVIKKSKFKLSFSKRTLDTLGPIALYHDNMQPFNGHIDTPTGDTPADNIPLVEKE